MSGVRVVVADDHPMVRYGIAAVLADVPEIELVGEAADGEELLQLVDRVQPDVVLTDLDMPGMGGAAAIRALATRRAELPVLVLTMHADDESLFTALRAGARGYLLKGADRAELVRAICSLAAGQAVYGAPVVSRVMSALTTRSPAQAFPGLTDREREVLGLLSAGRRNSEIAAALRLSDKTVRNHVSSLLLKLQVPDRTAAALKGREAGLG